MDQNRNTLRVGAAAIACALALRLGTESLYPQLVRWLRDDKMQSFLLYLETGRTVRFSPSYGESADPVGESPAPLSAVEWAQLPQAVFSQADAAGLELYYGCGYRPDLESLVAQPLSWDLKGSEPTVLILHTHTTESYRKDGADYEETSAYRTLDENYNMASIGDRLVQALSRLGITAIQDREVHDYPSYNGSYNHARSAIQAYLQAYPSIRLVLDLHRDASGDLNNQFRPTVQVGEETAAKLMLVIGTDASGLHHPDWQENLALGLKLHIQLERTAPGITRPICLRTSRFNQDLTAGALLIEVGAAGNSHEEALRAADLLAKAIASLAKGSE